MNINELFNFLVFHTDVSLKHSEENCSFDGFFMQFPFLSSYKKLPPFAVALGFEAALQLRTGLLMSFELQMRSDGLSLKAGDLFLKTLGDSSFCHRGAVSSMG